MWDGRLISSPPLCIVRKDNYGVADLSKRKTRINKEVSDLILFKMAAFAIGRKTKYSKDKATALYQFICRIIGYAETERKGGREIKSLRQLITPALLEDLVEWYIDVRKGKGISLVSQFGSLFASLREWIASRDCSLGYAIDLSWEADFVASIPKETRTVREDRMAMRCCDYEILDPIPGKIRQERLREEQQLETDMKAASKRGISDRDCQRFAAKRKEISELMMWEVLVLWLLYLPFRNRNIRECKLGANLAKKPLTRTCGVAKLPWVVEEEDRNSEAEFYQYMASSNETKGKNWVHLIIPRVLATRVEEFVEKQFGEKTYRSHLLNGSNSKNLFVNHAGNAMSLMEMTEAVGTITLRYADRRITPHVFRHVAAYRWLEANSMDFELLSRMLWHHSIEVTLRIYGSAYNESNGSARWEEEMENALEESESIQKRVRVPAGSKLGASSRSSNFGKTIFRARCEWRAH
jgi:integrase